MEPTLPMENSEPDDYYSPTAYTPDKVNDLLPPRSLDTYSRGEQHLRKYQLPKGVFCGELLGRLGSDPDRSPQNQT